MILAAAALYAVTLFYGPPMLVTVYLEPNDPVPMAGEAMNEAVRRSVCTALGREAEVAFPVAYRVMQWVQVPESRGYATVERGEGMIQECPLSGGTPA